MTDFIPAMVENLLWFRIFLCCIFASLLVCNNSATSLSILWPLLHLHLHFLSFSNQISLLSTPYYANTACIIFWSMPLNDCWKSVKQLLIILLLLFAITAMSLNASICCTVQPFLKSTCWSDKCPDACELWLLYLLMCRHGSRLISWENGSKIMWNRWRRTWRTMPCLVAIWIGVCLTCAKRLQQTYLSACDFSDIQIVRYYSS